MMTYPHFARARVTDGDFYPFEVFWAAGCVEFDGVDGHRYLLL
jgi:hypothetical protein